MENNLGCKMSYFNLQNCLEHVLVMQVSSIKEVNCTLHGFMIQETHKQNLPLQGLMNHIYNHSSIIGSGLFKQLNQMPWLLPFMILYPRFLRQHEQHQPVNGTTIHKFWDESKYP